MSKQQKPKRRTVVVTTPRDKVKPTVSRGRTAQKSTSTQELIFGWENYKFMLIGVGFMALGMILMLGGDMPDPNVWDEDIIYSFRRTVLAPLLILIGIGVEVYAIFRK